MNRYILTLVWLIFALSGALAQYDTGDRDLNLSLIQIDADASSDESTFQNDMILTFGVAPAKIELWTVQHNLRPGDVYMVLETSRILKKPADDVVKVYVSNRKKGWGAIAKELGIKPGSAEFHALKAGSHTQAAKGKGKKPK